MDRFETKVNRNGPVPAHAPELGPCHVWTGTRFNTEGYGQFYADGKRQLAHRVAWEREHGPIPPGVQVLHRCDNPPCVRESHLFAGNPKTNDQDKRRKGRQPSARGERNGRAKLTRRQVRTIRASAGKVTQRELAERYGVSQATISMIVTRGRWR